MSSPRFIAINKKAIEDQLQRYSPPRKSILNTASEKAILEFIALAKNALQATPENEHEILFHLAQALHKVRKVVSESKNAKPDEVNFLNDMRFLIGFDGSRLPAAPPKDIKACVNQLLAERNDYQARYQPTLDRLMSYWAQQDRLKATLSTEINLLGQHKVHLNDNLRRINQLTHEIAKLEEQHKINESEWKVAYQSGSSHLADDIAKHEKEQKADNKHYVELMLQIEKEPRRELELEEAKDNQKLEHIYTQRILDLQALKSNSEQAETLETALNKAQAELVSATQLVEEMRQLTGLYTEADIKAFGEQKNPDINDEESFNLLLNCLQAQIQIQEKINGYHTELESILKSDQQLIDKGERQDKEEQDIAAKKERRDQRFSEIDAHEEKIKELRRNMHEREEKLLAPKKNRLQLQQAMKKKMDDTAEQLVATKDQLAKLREQTPENKIVQIEKEIMEKKDQISNIQQNIDYAKNQRNKLHLSFSEQTSDITVSSNFKEKYQSAKPIFDEVENKLGLSGEMKQQTVVATPNPEGQEPVSTPQSQEPQPLNPEMDRTPSPSARRF